MAVILVVEDDAFNAQMLKRRLGRHGHEVLIASDGEQALEQVRHQRIDLILMDMSLPVMDGWEATRQLKASSQTATIPIIALTAHATSEDRGTIQEVGCDEFEPKPVDLKSLSEKITRLLKE